MCPILTIRRDGCANALIGKAGTAPISPSSSRRLIGPSQRFVASASSFDHLIGTGEEPVRNREAECMHRSMEGSVRARASKHSLCSRTCGDVPSCGFQDGQHGRGPPEVEESAAIGGNMLVVAGAEAEKVAEFIVSPAEPSG